MDPRPDRREDRGARRRRLDAVGTRTGRPVTSALI